MEIEFSAFIDPIKKRHELHAGLSFAAAGTLSLLLFALILQPIYPPSSIFFIVFFPANWLCFNRYRQMNQQEKTPDRLRFEKDSIIYSEKGVECLSIPIDAIARVEYQRGLAIFLKTPFVRRLTILHPNFGLSLFLAKAKRNKCDLFFEWFSPEITQKIKDYL